MVMYFREFLKQQTGSIITEFAFVLPFLLVLFFGSVELTRYILVLQKIDNTAYTFADVITLTPPVDDPTDIQVGELTEAFTTTLLNNTQDLMDPFWNPADVSVIATSIRVESPGGGAPPVPLIKWHTRCTSCLLTGEVSEVTGQPVTAGNGVPQDTQAQFSPEINNVINAAGGFNPGENIIVVEVLYDFRPMFSSIYSSVLGPIILKRNAFFTPRGDVELISLLPTYP